MATTCSFVYHPLPFLCGAACGAHVWSATSADLAGLVVEAASLDEVAEEVKLLVPQLLALQKHPATDAMSPAPFHRLVADLPASAMT